MWGRLGERSVAEPALQLLSHLRERGITVLASFTSDPTRALEGATHVDEREIATKADLVVAIGYFMRNALESVARRHPGTQFAILDEEVDLPNVASVRFREPEGCYLVGALAARKSRTGTVGIVLGMDVPLLRGFEHGYRQGAAAARPAARTVSAVANSFADPVRGKEPP